MEVGTLQTTTLFTNSSMTVVRASFREYVDSEIWSRVVVVCGGTEGSLFPMTFPWGGIQSLLTAKGRIVAEAEIAADASLAEIAGVFTQFLMHGNLAYSLPVESLCDFALLLEAMRNA